jgi:hypothetical protein
MALREFEKEVLGRELKHKTINAIQGRTNTNTHTHTHTHTKEKIHNLYFSLNIRQLNNEPAFELAGKCCRNSITVMPMAGENNTT